MPVRMLGNWMLGQWEVEQPLWKVDWQFLKELNRQLPRDLAVALEGICPRERKTCSLKNLTMYVWGNFVPRSPKLETSRCFEVGEREATVVHTHRAAAQPGEWTGESSVPKARCHVFSLTHIRLDLVSLLLQVHLLLAPQGQPWLALWCVI